MATKYDLQDKTIRVKKKHVLANKYVLQDKKIRVKKKHVLATKYVLQDKTIRVKKKHVLATKYNLQNNPIRVKKHVLAIHHGIKYAGIPKLREKDKYDRLVNEEVIKILNETNN